MTVFGIKAQMVKYGIRQGDLANILGISQSRLSKRLTGVTRVDETFIADALAGIDLLAEADQARVAVLERRAAS